MTPEQACELRAALERMDRAPGPRLDSIRTVIRILAREALEAAEVWDQQIGDRG